MPAKKFMPCEGCPSPAACKKAGKCMIANSKSNKPQRGGKQALAIMVAVGVPKKGKK